MTDKKYKYQCVSGRYGGEAVVGTVTKAFVDYWKPIVDEDGDGDLVDFLTDFDYETTQEEMIEDPDAMPLPVDDPDEYEPGAWFNFEDKEHINGPYADAGLSVYPIDEEGNEDYDNAEEIEFDDVYCYSSRECYTTDDISDVEDPENYTPVLAFHSAEKGQFFNFVLELDEPFDARLLATQQVETDIGSFIESVWYDGKEIELDFDWNDTTGKGYYATVGYLNNKWHDVNAQTFEQLEEDGIIEDWRESIEE